ncbi:cytochrome P450 4C1-like [Armigeres subalbatus]|uniref:cytochrome P450 4C1-like n=1 Tax=Armigeres subalbatus TaxID=124917 RepID=UPI002ED06BED
MVLSSTVLALLPVIALLALWWKFRRFYQISSELPGPINYPLVGCGHLFFGKSNEKRFAIVNDLTRTYPSPCRFWLGPKLFVFIDNAEDIQIVLNSPNCLEKAEPYRFIRSVRGLFTSPVDLWKVHRKLLSPCFNNAGLLTSFVSILNEKSKILVQRLEKSIGEESYDVYNDISRCTLDMICATFLGSDLNLQSNKGTKLIKAVEHGSELINNRFYNIWLHPEWIYRRTKHFREEQKCFEQFFALQREVLERRRKERTEITNDSRDQKKSNIFIDQVIQISEETGIFDDTDVRDEICTLIVAGNETSALNLSTIILMLAIHQEIQDEVHNEIVNVLEGCDPTIDHLARLKYTEMAIKEAMRLFPGGPVFGRKCTAPTCISKSVIPEGTNIILGIYNVHRNPKHWGTNVDSFDPDRFLPERVAARHPYAFLPFSAGLRNCVGHKYAIMDMKIILCYLLRSYRFRSPLKMDELQLTMSVTLKITNRQVAIERRGE